MPAGTPESKEELEKTNLKEFWNISKWAFLLSFRLDSLHTTLSLVSNILLNFRNVINSLIFAKIIDVLIKVSQSPNPSLKSVYPYLILTIAFQLFETVFSAINNYASTALRNTTRPILRQSYYKKLNSLGIQTLEQPHINNTMHRAENYLNEIIPYSNSLISFVANFFTAVGTIAIVFSYLPWFIPIMILTTIPYVLFDRRCRSIFYKYNFENTESSRISYNSASDLTSSNKLQEISISGSYNFLDKKFIEFQNIFTKGRLLHLKNWRVGSSSLGFLTDLVSFIATIKILLNFLIKTITVGDVTFQVRTVGNAQDSLMRIFRNLNDLFESSLYIRDSYILFNMNPIFSDGNETLPKLEKGPEIRLMNVTFKYPNSEKEVINNLNLRIKPGEKIAIVGHNGAGKTTLVKLISRIYKVTEGELLINNKNVDHLKIESLYKNMGVLFQDFNVHPQLTARENIYIGNSEEPINELGIRLAAQAADAIGFIEEFPKGFDQILGEKYKGGIRPSTGQWQKLAIARFFYRNSPLVIFDEPTASIDAVSEYNIFNKIYDFFKDKTVIIISHRFSTVRNADRIIVLEKGRIIEEGTHEHLMAEGGKYAEAFMLQAKGYTVK